MKKIAIVLGLGVSGKGALDLLLKEDYFVYAIDKNIENFIKIQNSKNFYKNVIFLKDDNSLDNQLSNQLLLENPREEIKVVVSPGIKLSHPIIRKIQNLKNFKFINITSEIDLAIGFFSKNDIKIIGVTGTNGKTTTSRMLAHVLNGFGIKTIVLGNIGKSLSSYVTDGNFDYSVIVLELSSFQLQLTKLRFLDMAIILNIFEDHLDHHKTFLEYAQSKCNISKLLKNNGKLLISDQVNEKFQKLTKQVLTKQVFTKQVLKNSRDNENFAKTALIDFGIDEINFKNFLKSFKKDFHRLEFVKEINKIKFFNDSKATNPSSVIYAINQFEKEENLILLVGGKDKKLSFSDWKLAFKPFVKKIYCFGEVRYIIKKELEEYNVEIVESLLDATKKAFAIASANDKIVFSPGCSSFDSFENYQKRGDTFKKYVLNL
jgi:UDP-N-acetylmuramoylalanine--D-glutamate ligase